MLARYYAAMTPPLTISQSLFSQESLISDILQSDHFQQYSPSDSYKRFFWKTAISYLEAREIEVEERIYEQYIALLSAPLVPTAQVPRPSYVTHFYPNPSLPAAPPKMITLLESRTTIENGTTGLRTWYSSFVFAEWLIRNPNVVQAQTVLELGCGSGFIGIVVASLQLLNMTPSTSLHLTDINPIVLEQCRSNIELPCNKLKSHLNRQFHLIDWSDALDEASDFIRESLSVRLHSIDANVLIGSDVAYDPTILPSLAAILDMWLSLPNTTSTNQPKFALIALSVRNLTTYEVFLDNLDRKNIKHKEIELFVNGSSPMFLHGTEGPEAVLEVKLFRLSR